MNQRNKSSFWVHLTSTEFFLKRGYLEFLLLYNMTLTLFFTAYILRNVSIIIPEALELGP